MLGKWTKRDGCMINCVYGQRIRICVIGSVVYILDIPIAFLCSPSFFVLLVILFNTNFRSFLTWFGSTKDVFSLTK